MARSGSTRPRLLFGEGMALSDDWSCPNTVEAPKRKGMPPTTVANTLVLLSVAAVRTISCMAFPLSSPTSPRSWSKIWPWAASSQDKANNADRNNQHRGEGKNAVVGERRTQCWRIVVHPLHGSILRQRKDDRRTNSGAGLLQEINGPRLRPSEFPTPCRPGRTAERSTSRS